MRRPVAIVALAALLSVTACSTGGGGSDAGGDKTTTTEAGGGDKTTTTTGGDDPSGGDADQAVADSVDATLDNPAFTVSSEANLSVGLQDFKLTTDGSIDYEALIADAEIGIDGGEDQTGAIKLLSDGTNLWIAATGDTGVELPAGKSWVEGSSEILADSDNFRPVDLIGVILALRGAQDTEVGETEEIDGVEAQQYSTTMTYDEAVDAAGEDAEAFQSALSLTSDDPVDLNIEVWIGDDGIIRRFQLEVDAPTGVPLGGDYRVELSDIGDEVDPPEAPPAGEVLTGAAADKILDQLIAS